MCVESCGDNGADPKVSYVWYLSVLVGKAYAD